MLSDLEIAARAGAQALMANRTAVRPVTQKGSGDFATEADLASERAIIAALLKSGARATIVAEEGAAPVDPLPRDFITVDPLDGTVIFARGCPEWGVLLSSVEDGRVAAGVMLQPELERCITFGPGGLVRATGAGGVQQSVLQLTEGDPERLLLSIDINMHTRPRHLSSLVDRLTGGGRVLITRTLGAAIANTAELLLGRVDAYLNPHGGKIWDFAPCAGAVEAAGGVALELDAEQQTVRQFAPNKLHLGVLFCRSLAVADTIIQAGGLRW